ncbi:MCM DNA helicase complex subunit, partial [Exophiala xenobiotica]
MSAANRGPGNAGRRKRARDDEDEIMSSSPAALPSSPPLLPTNENDDLEDDDLDAEDDLIGDVDDLEEMAEDEDGIDLFGDNFMNDEREGRNQETYQGRMIDDDGDYDDLDLATRRQLEA